MESVVQAVAHVRWTVFGMGMLLCSFMCIASADAAGRGEAKSPTSMLIKDRPTIQRRFAPKTHLFYGNAFLMAHVRDDFYDSWGLGADLGFFMSESWGAEFRLAKINTTLSEAVIDLKDRIGLVPDARPQDLWLKLGVRWAPAYGKMLIWDDVVIHFDPQLALHGGVAFAEKRILPSFLTSFSLLMHFKWNIKAKLDLGMSIQGEERDRGWVWTLGFVPTLGVGWGFNL